MFDESVSEIELDKQEENWKERILGQKAVLQYVQQNPGCTSFEICTALNITHLSGAFRYLRSIGKNSQGKQMYVVNVAALRARLFVHSNR